MTPQAAGHLETDLSGGGEVHLTFGHRPGHEGQRSSQSITLDPALGQLYTARQRERESISRDLHDRISHDLVVALQLLEGTSQAADVERSSADEASARIRHALDDIRELMGRLRQQVGERSLEVAIAEQLERLPATPAVILECLTPARRLSPPIAEEVLVIVLEAVRNARIHSAAHKVIVETEWHRDSFRVSVVDDGMGFTIDSLKHPNYGVRSMSERAKLVNGLLTIDSGQSGTNVTLIVPSTAGTVRG
ncbi:sensor histidine kinase [Schumannella luteola]